MHALLLVASAPLFILLMNKTVTGGSAGFGLTLASTIACTKHSIIKNISDSLQYFTGKTTCFSRIGWKYSWLSGAPLMTFWIKWICKRYGICNSTGLDYPDCALAKHLCAHLENKHALHHGGKAAAFPRLMPCTWALRWFLSSSHPKTLAGQRQSPLTTSAGLGCGVPAALGWCEGLGESGGAAQLSHRAVWSRVTLLVILHLPSAQPKGWGRDARVLLHRFPAVCEQEGVSSGAPGGRGVTARCHCSAVMGAWLQIPS